MIFWLLLNSPSQFPISPFLLAFLTSQNRTKLKLLLALIQTKPSYKTTSCTSWSNALSIFFFFVISEEQYISLSKTVQGLNAVIYTKTWSTIKVSEAIWALSKGFAALKGCDDVFWHLVSWMVLLTALHGHSEHHTLPSKKSIPVTYKHLEIPACQRFLGDFVMLLLSTFYFPDAHWSSKV